MNPVSLVLLLLALQSSPVEGPISDMIGSRVDKLAARVEAWKTESEQAQQTRFAEFMQAIAEARQERKTLLDSIGELKQQRDGLFAGLAEFRNDRDGILARLQDVREEVKAATEKWNPLKAIIERLEALVWSLFKFFFALCVLVIAVGSVGLFLYFKIKQQLTAIL